MAGEVEKTMVSLVIPVFNEREALPDLALQVREACAKLGTQQWECIFIDDGSDDGSRTILSELAAGEPNFKLITLRRNFGKAAALSAGFEQSRGESVVTLDADLQDDPAEIPAMLQKLGQGYDLVSGWKRKRRDPLFKRFASRLFNWATAKLTGVGLHDFNCGLKAYNSEAAKDLVIYGELYRYIPVLCHQQGFSVTEIEVNHRPRRYGKSKFGRERYMRGLFDLFTVLFMGRYRSRPLHLFGGLGLIMMAIGVVISAYLTVIKIGGEAIGRRPLLMLGVLLIVVGVQFLSLGLIGEMIVAERESRQRDGRQRYRAERPAGGEDGQR